MSSCSKSAIQVGLGLVLVLCSTCGDDEWVMVKLVADDSCTESLVQEVRSAQAELRAPTAQRTCFDLNGEAESVGDLQAMFSEAISFKDVEEGRAVIYVFGYQGTGCEGDDVILCGHVSFDLPPEGDIVEIPVSCYQGSSPPDTFKGCAGL